MAAWVISCARVLPRISRPCCAVIKQGQAFYGRPVPCTCITPSTMLWNCQCTFYGILSQMTYTIIKQAGNRIILQGLKIFLFLHILYIVSFHWLIPYPVLHFPCNWFLCASFYGDTAGNACMRHSPALHTLLSLYDCASSITTPCKWYTAGFYFGKFNYLFSEQEWHGFTGNCGRQE